MSAATTHLGLALGPKPCVIVFWRRILPATSSRARVRFDEESGSVCLDSAI